MNKLRPTIKLALFISVASLFFAACSDDDDKSIPVPEPSRMITGIKVHKISDVITYQGMISLTYDNNKRLTRIYSSSPLAAVNYTYKENSEVSYTYSTENSPLVEISTSLENGRSYVCKFSNRENPVTYSYDNEGYLKSCNNNGTVLEYNWESGNLSSITTTPRGTYNSDYRVSNIANDYSLHLNTLAQWIDDRENYTTVMNTFGQMAEILGKRSANILEDTYYIYDYSFRQDGRLKDMTLMGGSENIGYSFRFSYADDTEVSE